MTPKKRTKKNAASRQGGELERISHDLNNAVAAATGSHVLLSRLVAKDENAAPRAAQLGVCLEKIIEIALELQAYTLQKNP